MRLVRDLPVTLDLEAASIGRVRPRGCHPALPRVRVPDPDRAPAAASRRAARGSRRGAGGRDRQRRRCALAGDDRPDAAAAAGGGQPGRSIVGEGLGLQLSLDFDAVGGAAAAMPRGDRRPPAAGRHEARRSAGRPPGARAAIADPGRLELRRGRRRRRARRLARRPARRRGRASSSMTHDRPRPTACPRRSPDPTAGRRGRRPRGVVGAARHLLDRTARPLVGHEVKPLSSLARRRPGGRTRRRSRSTPRSRPTSSMPRCAARRSPTWRRAARPRSCRRPVELPPAPGPASRRWPPSPSGEPLRDALVEEQPRPAVRARSSCRSSRFSPGWRRSGSPSTARRSASSTASSRRRSTRLEREIYDSVGHEFNLGSPKQLEQVLFFELDLPKGRRTKTGYSTDASVLEELRAAHPMIDRLLEWRTYTKLRSTYVEALPSLLAADGRLHTTFHQAVAATGRLSSSDPNLQNIPIRTPLGRRIRRAFVAGAPDVTLLAADYSQIELRILAHVSGDAHLKDAFAREADIHRETAARVLHKDAAEVTADERSMAKMVNFGIAYGMSDFGLSSAGPASAARRPRSSSTATSRPTPASATTCSTSRRRPRARASSRRCSAGSARSPS